MIKPALSGDQFIADVRAARAQRGVHLWWLGQSGFLLQCDGAHVLLDPYLSDSLTEKYAGTHQPHVRMSIPVIAPARLSFVEIVTSSHNHTDHLDPQTIGPIVEANPNVQLIVPEANRTIAAQRLKLEAAAIMGIEAGMINGIRGFDFIGVPAAHPERQLDEHQCDRFMGLVVRAGNFTVYHSGDTMRSDEVVDALRGYYIDIAILPINGKLGNMSGVAAVRFAREIGAKIVIPCHYDMFEFNTADPYEQFVPECERIGQAYRVLKLGERFTYPAESSS